jgi:hypothetical protein
MKFYPLFDHDGPRIPLHGSPTDVLPVLSLDPLVAPIKAAQETLRSTRLDDLIGLCDAAAAAWVRPDHPIHILLRRWDLGFLPFWMRRENLRQLCERSLRGRPECLDRLAHLNDSDPMLVRAQPRGVVVHWLAGNVPVLGLLSLLMSFLCKNVNVMKPSSQLAGLLGCLLEGFRNVEYTSADGQTIRGQLLLDTTAVIYVEQSDRDAARALSTVADVRVAWGGREAVEAVLNLPRRYGTEDIVFGPKLSLAIIAAERLGDAASARRVALALARDACAFDQQGCNSPHTVFVQRGGGVAPPAFAKLLGEAMEIVRLENPPTAIDPAAAMNVLGTRAEYDIRGQAFCSRGTDWTVVYADEDQGLAEPCYWRTLFVRPIDDLFEPVPFCSLQTQTVGLAVDQRRSDLVDALTARGVARCPNIGKMRLFDAPWDGLFPMDRLVRWSSSD